MHVLNGPNHIVDLNRSQTSRFRAEWKENVLTLGMCKKGELFGYFH